MPQVMCTRSNLVACLSRKTALLEIPMMQVCDGKQHQRILRQDVTESLAHHAFLAKIMLKKKITIQTRARSYLS